MSEYERETGCMCEIDISLRLFKSACVSNGNLLESIFKDDNGSE